MFHAAQFQHPVNQRYHPGVMSLIRGAGEVDGANRNPLHVLVNEAVAVLSSANAKGNTDIANYEPKQPAVKNAKQIKVGRTQAISGVGKVVALGVQAETWALCNIWKNYLGRLEGLVVRDVVLNLVPFVLARFAPNFVGRVFLRGQFSLPFGEMLPDGWVGIDINAPLGEYEPSVFVMVHPSPNIFAAEQRFDQLCTLLVLRDQGFSRFAVYHERLSQPCRNTPDKSSLNKVSERLSRFHDFVEDVRLRIALQGPRFRC